MILFQSTNLHNDEGLKILDGAKQLNMEWQEFGVIPFSYELTNFDEYNADRVLSADKVVVHSGIKLLNHPKNPTDDVVKETFPLITDVNKARELYRKVQSGIFYSEPERFDQSTYTSYTIQQYMLNGDCEIAPFNDALLDRYFEQSFIKPGSDLKHFTAGVIENMTLRSYLAGIITNSSMTKTRFDVIISPVKRTITEWRFYIVDGEIVTESQYFHKGVVRHDNFVPQTAKDVAMEYKDIFHPQRTPATFVMDIALLENGEYKIVEYNCFNCSGLYKCNIINYLQAFL